MFAIDTNVFAYATFASDDGRKDAAARLIAAATLVDAILPMRVIVEFANASIKRKQLSIAVARQRITDWSDLFEVIPTEPGDVLAALDFVASLKLSYFDALICVTARRAGATALLTEDMHDGMFIDGLQIINPFAPANAAKVAALLAA